MNLEERCLMLEEENRQLRNAMRIPDKARYPAKWRLNGAESRVLSSLINAPAGGDPPKGWSALDKRQSA